MFGVPFLFERAVSVVLPLVAAAVGDDYKIEVNGFGFELKKPDGAGLRVKIVFKFVRNEGVGLFLRLAVNEVVPCCDGGARLRVE